MPQMRIDAGDVSDEIPESHHLGDVTQVFLKKVIRVTEV